MSLRCSDYFKRYVFKYVIICILCFFGTGNVSAEDDLLAGADLGYGEYLAGECLACHHSEGESKGIPSITGWDPETFVSVMRAYRAKEIDHNVMQMITGRLADDEIASLAIYFSTLEEGQ
jgi:cytochrome c